MRDGKVTKGRCSRKSWSLYKKFAVGCLGGEKGKGRTVVYEASGARFRISQNSENVTQPLLHLRIILALLSMCVVPGVLAISSGRRGARAYYKQINQFYRL